MLLSVKPLTVILPILGVQYVLAVFALTRLAMCRFKAKRYVIWNICIVLGAIVGPVVFLIYYYTVRKAIAESEERAEDEARRRREEAADKCSAGSRLGDADGAENIENEQARKRAKHIQD